MTTTPDQAPQTVARRPLGRNYGTLLTASVVSNLGDGIDRAALPLLTAALTRDPVLFSAVAVAGRLPWLLFALQAGAIADRVDRKRLMAGVNVIRFGLMALLGAAVLGGWATIGLLLVIAFVLGVAETLFDNAAQALMPAIVDRDQLERANGRLFGAEMVANEFVGPPLGGVLFATAVALPFLIDAASFLVSAALIATMTGTFVTARAATRPRTTIRVDVAEGLRWLRSHRLLRTLALLLGLMNGLATMAMATFALFATDPGILGLDEVGFGVLLTAGAIGSLVASLVAGRLVDRLGRGPTLWLTLVASVVVPLATGLSSSAVVVGVLSAMFGFAAVVWNVVTVSLRQTIIPDDLLGRVNAVYRFLGWGSMPIGALLGGIVADLYGLRAPWIVAGVAMALALIPARRVITSETIEAARAAAA